MSTVIKAGQTGPLLAHLSSVDLADHLAEAQAVVDQAKRTAARIREDAKHEAERLHAEAMRAGQEEGHGKGYKQGTEDGHRDAHQEASERFEQQQSELISDFRRSIDAMDSMKDHLRVKAERDVLDFAVDLARRLTFAFGLAHRESAIENLRRALVIVGTKSAATVRVHPADIEAMKDFAGSVVEQLTDSHAVKLVEDESIAPGGCDVTNEDTHVDATLETQVEEMMACLLGAPDSNG